MYRELILELTQNNAFAKIQPPCSDSEIDGAEKAAGYSFPKELRALLKELNGDKYLLLSAKEIAEQAELNREFQKAYSGEEFAKEPEIFEHAFLIDGYSYFSGIFLAGAAGIGKAEQEIAAKRSGAFRISL